MRGFQERWIVGKTVAAVQRERFYNERIANKSTDLESITFTDGSMLVFNGELTEDGTYVSALYMPAERRRTNEHHGA
jgi:hypothetical protein